MNTLLFIHWEKRLLVIQTSSNKVFFVNSTPRAYVENKVLFISLCGLVFELILIQQALINEEDRCSVDYKTMITVVSKPFQSTECDNDATHMFQFVSRVSILLRTPDVYNRFRESMYTVTSNVTKMNKIYDLIEELNFPAVYICIVRLFLNIQSCSENVEVYTTDIFKLYINIGSMRDTSTLAVCGIHQH